MILVCQWYTEPGLGEERYVYICMNVFSTFLACLESIAARPENIESNPFSRSSLARAEIKDSFDQEASPTILIRASSIGHYMYKKILYL